MTDLPPVIVLLVTYRRLPLALATIRAVKEHLRYPNLGWHIADDGSGPEYVARLVEEIGDTYEVTVSDAARQGVGVSQNLGIAAVLERADLWLHLEDDWVLPGPLDLEPCATLLVDDPTVGMVRLGRLSAHLQAYTMAGANRIWWAFHRGCDTYVFTGNPSLRSRAFHEAYGPYATDLMPGQTELDYCGRFNGKEGPAIVWPAWLSDREVFQHIGDSHSYKVEMEGHGMTAEAAADLFEQRPWNG